jgi:dTDP-4-dehydrorhamnose reductase
VSRYLVTGAGGQLGADLLRELSAVDGAEIRGVTRSDVDISVQSEVNACVSDFRPDVVLNTAAYTAVDAAEVDEERALAANGTGPAYLAVACAAVGARLLHVSTDYVFAGDGTSPYTVDAPTAPRSAYGRTKLAGEMAVRAALPDRSYVVRTAWVYGAHGRNFVKTMARLEAERDTLSVVADQVGSPTWSADLARGLVALARSQAPAGVYHCTNAGQTNWCDFARAIFVELGADPERVKPISTGEYPVAAPRPAYSVLSSAEWIAAGLPPLQDWRAALHQAFVEAGEEYRPAKLLPT